MAYFISSIFASYYFMAFTIYPNVQLHPMIFVHPSSVARIASLHPVDIQMTERSVNAIRMEILESPVLFRVRRSKQGPSRLPAPMPTIAYRPRPDRRRT